MSDTHTVINAACAKVLDTSWQSCRVDVVRNAPAHAGTTSRCAVHAFIAIGFARSDAQDIDTARWCEVADNSTPGCQSPPPSRNAMRLEGSRPRPGLHVRVGVPPNVMCDMVRPRASREHH